MNNKFKSKLVYIFGNSIMRLSTGMVMVFLAGCTGMYSGIQGERNTSSGTLDEDIVAQVDIHTITPQLVYEQQQSREAAEQLNEARNKLQNQQPKNDKYVYLLSPRDVLNITVWNHPELNNPAGQLSSELSGRVIDDNGNFFYPYVGTVHAAGRTVESIRSELTRRLTDYLMEPQVDVSVLKYLGRRVYAVGQFKSPGPQPITNRPLYVTDLVTQVGGYTDEADLRLAKLTRKNGLVQMLNLDSLYRNGDVSQNVMLHDGDILELPETRYNKIFVLGEVDKPQSMLLPYGRYSLSEALSDAGGLNPTTSNGKQVYVMRAGSGGRPEVWHLNASKPSALVLADGFELQARDVVFVDAAAVTRWARVINQMLPSLSGANTLDSIIKR